MELDGVLLLDKPNGPTSHDMVDRVRRKFGLKKVGHCGTLDPAATGLLMIGIGKATKIQDLLMAEDKVYAGRMKLGVTTDSQDAQGAPLETKEVPPFTPEQIAAAFAKYQGDFYQTPPMVSAVKKDGVPLYKLARAGKTVEREPRLVHVYSHRITELALPEIAFEITCSKGFYVRTYCHDIGADLGCGAHLTALSRLRSGNFSLDRAVSWETLDALPGVQELSRHVLSLPEISRLRRQ
ncbi:tRNA pseudouridine55 synthase [Verrucomicrobium sp. GAS474]|uniref:tRNA pseudouridine(55) synthase TruB n=1 Tax=Verrucomicrobium sp. GAS474 TaxID=1882831 RepID=UPI00087B50C2|nr:tRNA pseudouridine(55) synthase TruB [Verrucomicrobium sp. GAS474]SDT91806.1 tRNA pseudouridine55 synthase [Verrucomicrobium sp. GAS474]